MVDILGKTFEFLKKLDKDQQRIHKETMPESPVSEGVGGDTIIKGMDETGIDALNKAIKDTGYKGPGLNLNRIALIFKEEGGEQTVDLTSMFANIKEQNKELFEHLRRPTQTMEMLLTMAQQTGYREIVYKFLNRKPGEILPSDDLVGGLVMMLKLGKEIQDKALAITKTDDLGEKQQIYRELTIISTIQSNLVPQVSGNLSEMMRGGAVASNIQKIANININEYGTRLNEVIKDLDENIIDYAVNYANWDNKYKAGELTNEITNLWNKYDNTEDKKQKYKILNIINKKIKLRKEYGAHPKTYNIINMDDIVEIKNMKSFFLRKFSNDSNIIDYYKILLSS